MFGLLKYKEINGDAKFPVLMLALFFVFWTAASIGPYDRFNWFLENILVILACAVLIGTYKYFRFTNLSYFLIMLFLMLHTVGAHYSYSLTPVDSIINGIFNFERNNYDRIVHFSFGFLLAYPVLDFTQMGINIKGSHAAVFSVISILAFGAFYELIEMWVAKLVDPDAGLMFLGIQGDIWDTQNDMALALYGAIIAILIVNIIKKQM